MKHLSLLLFVLVLFLAGCAAPTPVAAPAEPTATLPAPTVTSSVTDSLPTATVPPTTMPATSTPDARQQEQAALLPLVAPCTFADQPIVYSPQKAWVVVTCQGDQPEAGTTTKFVRMDGSQQWSLSLNETYLKPFRAGDPNLNALLQKAFIPVRWTKNEDFAYLAVQTVSDETAYQGYDGLFRLDLATGKLRSVLKPAAAPLSATYAFKFSPNGTRLAYINQSVQPIAIVIINTETGEEQRMSLDARFTKGGSLLWSPNEKQLVVSVLDEGKNGGNSVILYDLEAQTNQYLIGQSATTYLPLEWTNTNLIYAESYPGSWVYIDPATQAVTSAPEPTPAP